MSPSLKSQVTLGDQVFLVDGGEEVGAVRDLCGHRPEIIVYVENGGEFTVPATAIKAVHYHKVILDAGKLPPDLQRAFLGAHDAESE